eukprot:11252278-Heterocapsa_arctica.AAC.1
MKLVVIKPTPKGGLGADAVNKRKHEALEQERADKGKGGYKGGQWGTRSPGYAGQGQGSASGWQDR